ncbi:unnamed protein product [Trifolium pratense]|uniref:Uncharacterized protein n=1 Tax=Trifolium pratense TaxID=57577 RepID=A0ACB0JNX5_TRIPR|nr:unnamed protein product [Trifolium pratense]
MSAFVVRQDDQKKRGFEAPPNRYWDGVDRSNGFEKELLKKLNEKKAQEKVAYLSCVSSVKNITHRD